MTLRGSGLLCPSWYARKRFANQVESRPRQLIQVSLNYVMLYEWFIRIMLPHRDSTSQAIASGSLKPVVGQRILWQSFAEDICIRTTTERRQAPPGVTRLSMAVIRPALEVWRTISGMPI